MKRTYSNYFIECVPNISEGRDQRAINKILSLIATEGVQILNHDTGSAAHRTVITLAGSVESVLECIFKLYKAAAKYIDMTLHTGTHPRLGVIDICPFIAFDTVHQADLIQRVNALAKAISDELEIPIFLYSKSSIGSYKTLPNIRKGEYEQLMADNSKLKYKADFGASFTNPNFGGSVMGVRDFMVAYNVNLNTTDIKIAKAIAKKMRHIRTTKGKYNSIDINNVQILAWYIEDLGCCQISTNIHDTRNLSLVDIYRFTKEVALGFGLKVTSSELIGMIPEHVLEWL